MGNFDIKFSRRQSSLFKKSQCCFESDDSFPLLLIRDSILQWGSFCIKSAFKLLNGDAVIAFNPAIQKIYRFCICCNFIKCNLQVT